jgi:cellulose synthase operon protein YhjQ
MSSRPCSACPALAGPTSHGDDGTPTPDETRVLPLIVFASPKGGVGKTTLAANTAHELARRGHRVIVADVDPQNALGMHFGADPYERAGFNTTLTESNDARRVWQGALQTTASGVGLLPHGHASFAQAIEIGGALSQKPELLAAPFRDILQDPETIVIVDTPPGPGPALTAITSLADMIVVVLLADAASIVQIPKIEGDGMYADAEGVRLSPERFGFVINQIDMRSRLSRAAAEAASRHLGDRLLGSVYRDEHVPEALARQSGVNGYAPASKAAQDIAAITTRIEAAATSSADTT